jgi:hypothetical protein
VHSEGKGIITGRASFRSHQEHEHAAKRPAHRWSITGRIWRKRSFNDSECKQQVPMLFVGSPSSCGPVPRTCDTCRSRVICVPVADFSEKRNVSANKRGRGSRQTPAFPTGSIALLAYRLIADKADILARVHAVGSSVPELAAAVGCGRRREGLSGEDITIKIKRRPHQAGRQKCKQARGGMLVQNL